MNVREQSIIGLQVGAAIAIIPAAATLLIASSRAILVNIIANTILRILTAGQVDITIYASLIQVPLLWKISMVCAVAGSGVMALSALAFLVNYAYLHCSRGAAQPLNT